jgi:hypothetical protein
METDTELVPLVVDRGKRFSHFFEIDLGQAADVFRLAPDPLLGSGNFFL